MSSASYSMPSTSHNTVPDNAFEPDPDFAFEDSAEGFHDAMAGLVSSGSSSGRGASGSSARNRQSDMAYVKAALQPQSDAKASHTLHSQRDSFDHMAPKMQWRQSLMSPLQQTGQAGFHIPQSNMASHSTISQHVSQQFGQITPPEDGSTPRSLQQDQPPQHELPATSKLTKSERARNAANQRHSKVKKAKAEAEASIEDDDSGSRSDSNGFGADDKKERYREKNRAAAAKCRAKKKESTDALEDMHRAFSARSKMLKREEQDLREELLQLKSKALQHTNCTCAQIHQYNARQAQRYAESGGAGHRSPIPFQDQNNWQDAVRSPSFFENLESPRSAHGFDFTTMSAVPDVSNTVNPCDDQIMQDFFKHG